MTTYSTDALLIHPVYSARVRACLLLTEELHIVIDEDEPIPPPTTSSSVVALLHQSIASVPVRHLLAVSDIH